MKRKLIDKMTKLNELLDKQYASELQRVCCCKAQSIYRDYQGRLKLVSIPFNINKKVVETSFFS